MKKERQHVRIVLLDHIQHMKEQISALDAVME
jgi:hypothetical protein